MLPAVAGKTGIVRGRNRLIYLGASARAFYVVARGLLEVRGGVLVRGMSVKFLREGADN
jgi:hypothetical protein